MKYHLAHLNLAKLRAPIDDPLIKEFKDGIDIINALAERSQGFIWRLKEDDQYTTNSSYKIMGDEMIIFTLSVWENWNALKLFTYNTDHAEYFKKRKLWFEKLESNNYVLWHIKIDHIPTLAEGLSRLKFLHNKGETSKAFTFKTATEWSALIQE